MKKTVFLSNPTKLTALLFLTTLTFFSFWQLPQDPIATLDHPTIKVDRAAVMSMEEFQKSKGVILMSMQAYEVAGYSVVRVPKGVDPVEVTNHGGVYGERTSKLIEEATSGDAYYFEGIKAKLPNMQDEKEWKNLKGFVVKIE
jgi:hypothetical protein